MRPYSAAVLFKKFAGIDAVDLEINEKDPQKLAAIVRALEPSFGAVNLEDIKAPECFEVGIIPSYTCHAQQLLLIIA